jgi:nucleotide-binding universal stress UspA family protein
VSRISSPWCGHATARVEEGFVSFYHRILVPVDGSDTAQRGLKEAIGLAAQQQSALHLLHIVDRYPMLAETASIDGFQETLDGLRREGDAVLTQACRAATEAGVVAEASLREVTRESLADAIADEAMQKECDLIVMGTHGRHGLSHLAMGSHAELVVRCSPVPVLLVRRDETGPSKESRRTPR